MERVNLTERKFFRVLPRLKKYGPVVTRTGNIRFGRKNKGYCMCPLTAYRKEITGTAGKLEHVHKYFNNYALTSKIVSAADDLSIADSKFRNRMLKALGLPTEKAKNV